MAALKESNTANAALEDTEKTPRSKIVTNTANAALEDTEKAPRSELVTAPRMNYDLHEAQFGKPFIAISGIIGAGKTTLATALGEALALPVFFEPVIDNTYLADFYGDMKTYAFPLQVFLLNKRFAQQQKIIWSGDGGVQDRSIYEDAVFARMLRNSGHMDQRDYDTWRAGVGGAPSGVEEYLSLFNNMSNFMRKPNVLIHLEVSPEESLRRITTRSRGCEVAITIDYLRNLHNAYEEFIEDISRVIPVIKVAWETFQNTEDVFRGAEASVAASVRDEYLKLSAVRKIDFPATGPVRASPAKARAA